MGSIATAPETRWGVVGAGLISSWFVSDLTLDRPNAPTTHLIAAIGSSSLSKASAFAAKNIPSTHRSKPHFYDTYDAVYNDPGVDIVYIGTPHSFHKRNCLDAIKAGKHVLCEKPFTINTREAEEVLEAAKQAGVFVMEAMWTRFHPLVTELRQKLFVEKAIGDVRRTFCDFGLDMPIAKLGNDSRLKSKELGAGSLLDIGVYSLTWSLLTLDEGVGEHAEELSVLGAQSLVDGVDVATSILLKYPKTGRQGVSTCTLEAKGDEVFCRIVGSAGFITVSGPAPSMPRIFTVHPKADISTNGDAKEGSLVEKEKQYDFDTEGMGFYYEADAVATDVLAGRKENAIMPHAETLRVMRLVDEVRRQGGARFPQDDE